MRQEGCHSDRSEAERRNLSGHPQITQMTQIPKPEEMNRQGRQERQGSDPDPRPLIPDPLLALVRKRHEEVL